MLHGEVPDHREENEQADCRPEQSAAATRTGITGLGHAAHRT
ncbi:MULTISPECIES: hypothetical protein [unclassified Streptomyces]|nr:hypothetical protein OG457_17295 [Streptomyces sp. NBC_01207]